MRLFLPALVPLACLVALPLMPQHTGLLLSALAASIVTLGLAAPALIATAASRPPATAADATVAPARAPSSSASRPSIDARVWTWRIGIAVEVGLVVWTFVSLSALVIVPEQAGTWSIHLGFSMLALMLATPALLFLKPNPRAETADPSAKETSAPQAFVPETEQQIRRPEPRQSGHASPHDATGDSAPGHVPDVQPRTASTATRNTQASSTDQESDTGAIWAHWPDDDEPTGAQSASSEPAASQPAESTPRSLWSFSNDDNAFGDRRDAPDPQREARVAAEVAQTSWGDGSSDDDEPMAWDILESILEEDEAGGGEPESSWEPDDWPDFNYDV